MIVQAVNSSTLPTLRNKGGMSEAGSKALLQEVSFKYLDSWQILRFLGRSQWWEMTKSSYYLNNKFACPLPSSEIYICKEMLNQIKLNGKWESRVRKKNQNYCTESCLDI